MTTEFIIQVFFYFISMFFLCLSIYAVTYIKELKQDGDKLKEKVKCLSRMV